MCDWTGTQPFYLDDWCRIVRPEGTLRFSMPEYSTADASLFVDRSRVNDLFSRAFATGGQIQPEETFITDWQFDAVQSDGGRSHCFCQLYPTGPSPCSPYVIFAETSSIIAGNSFVGVLTVSKIRVLSEGM